MTTRTIDDLLATARTRLQRLDPDECLTRQRAGALLVDTRPEENRRTEGMVPGALVIGRNVLEWRLDPRCDARIPEAANHDVEVILFCNEGYATSLAAATLQDLGLHRATDMIGGYRAWAAAGLPTEHCPAHV